MIMCILSVSRRPHRLHVQLVHRGYSLLDDRRLVGREVDLPVRHRKTGVSKLTLQAYPHLCTFLYGLFSGLIFILSIGETRSLITARC
jgi:hypothetical protein